MMHHESVSWEAKCERAETHHTEGKIMSDRDRVQLLLWRAGFGATPAQVDAATQKGYTAAVEDVLSYPDQAAPNAPTVPPIPDVVRKGASADEIAASMKDRNAAISEGNKAIFGWWADLMRTSGTPLQENLTLFWHNHFATGVDKVRYPALMLQQNQTLRTQGAGKFVDLLIAVSKDPAMLIYLDGRENVKGHANENWAREVMELFTLGIGNYTEADVREGARASTGYTLDANTGAVKFVPNRFDGSAKTILGQTGNFNMDDFSRLLAARPETAQYISKKLFTWFAGSTPSDGDLAPMIQAWNSSGGEIRSVLRALFTSDAFTPDHATTAFIKSPAAWTIGALRSLSADIDGAKTGGAMTVQGMTLFYPPNVGGWPHGMAWISPTSQVQRFNIAGQLIQKVAMLNGPADAGFLTQIADQLGGIPLSDDLSAKLLDFGKGPDGKRAVTQLLLAGPGFQTR